jgi:hypothetical protein
MTEPSTLPTVSDDTTSLMQVIARVASDPTVDVGKLERLLAMQERVIALQSRTEYFAAMAEMQPLLPIIAERGKLVIREKETRKILQVTPYATWEDICEQILPILGAHGFSLWFRTGVAADGKLTVTGILSHKGGHTEETTLALQHDSTGSKNAVQAVGSTTSYGKRYTAGALLNLNSRAEEDRDTDGDPGAEMPISPDQVEHIRKLIVEAGADIGRFLVYARAADPTIKTIEDIKVSEYAYLCKTLEQKRGAQ